MNPERPLDFGDIDRVPPTWNPQRPLRIALLGDYGGNALAGRLDTGAALARRKPRRVEPDTLDRTMARICPSLTLPLGTDGSSVVLPINGLDSFLPDSVVRGLDIFSALASLRRRLANNLSFVQAAEEIREWTLAAPAAPWRPAPHGPARGSRLRRDFRLDDFARLGSRAPAARQAASESLIRQLVCPFVRPPHSQDQASLVAALDQALASTLSAVLHQPDLQNAESLWRGVDFLLQRLNADQDIQVYLLDVSAEEFAADIAAQADLSRSGLYKLLVDDPSDEPDGGYSHVAACYYFEATPPQAELLGRAARICAYGGATFLGAIETDLLADSGQAIHPLVRSAFDALRGLPEAAFLALLSPRFLLRLPHGRNSEPVTAFRYEEFTASDGLRGMLWGHPSLLALVLLTGPADARTINRMPFHCYAAAAGESLALPCTERLLDDEAAGRLRGFGINAVLARTGEPRVTLPSLEAVDGAPLRPARGASRPPPVRRPARPQAERMTRSPTVADAEMTALLSIRSPDDWPSGTAGGSATPPMEADLKALLASLG